jgi:hypothetical protein
MSKLTVDGAELYMVYQHLKEALGGLQLLLADLGCLHHNGINISSFQDKARGVTKMTCPDCGVTFEEEIKDGLEEL